MANIDPDRLAGGLRRLGATADHDINEAVDEVVHACVALMRVNGCGLMIADEQNSLHYIAASDGASHRLEEAQSRTGEGPCVEAFVLNRTVGTQDVRSDDRWPAVGEALAGHGIAAVLGSPLGLGGVAVGTIDVWRDEPGPWDESEHAVLSRFGDVVQSTLTAALAAHRAGEIAGQLQYALDYRVIIERGVGYLMAQRGLDSVAAFNLLRRTAREQRRRIGDLAQELLDNGRLPGG